jgi:hypothetical protein
MAVPHSLTFFISDWTAAFRSICRGTAGFQRLRRRCVEAALISASITPVFYTPARHTAALRRNPIWASPRSHFVPPPAR